MPLRPEDYSGTTDPLAPLANLSTMPGHGAGKAIDRTRPSAADLIPTQPGPTADRIAELKANIEHWHRVIGRFGSSTQPERDELARYEAELSRLSNPELNSRGDPMDAATIARGRRPADSDNAPFRNEQPKEGDAMSNAYPDGNEPQCYSGDGPWRNTSQPKREPQIGGYHSIMGEALIGEPIAPSPATSPGPQDVREADAHLNAILHYTEAFYAAAIKHGLPAVGAADAVQHVEKAARRLHALAALARSDAQPVGELAMKVVEVLHLELEEYELRDPDHTPNDFERYMLEDFGTSMLGRLSEHGLLRTTPPSLPEGAREALGTDEAQVNEIARVYRKIAQLETGIAAQVGGKWLELQDLYKKRAALRRYAGDDSLLIALALNSDIPRAIDRLIDRTVLGDERNWNAKIVTEWLNALRARAKTSEKDK